MTRLLFSSHCSLTEAEGDADSAGQIRSVKLYDVPYSAGVAELWKSKIAGGHDLDGDLSNQIAWRSGPAPARYISEQITCSAKGYDSQ